MHARFTRPTWASVLLASIVAFGAGTAFAADSPLDEANALIQKAAALLKSAESASDKPEAAAHRKKAVELLTRAQSEILKAKQ
jgi:hypothetical protein